MLDVAAASTSLAAQATNAAWSDERAFAPTSRAAERETRFDAAVQRGADKQRTFNEQLREAGRQPTAAEHSTPKSPPDSKLQTNDQPRSAQTQDRETQRAPTTRRDDAPPTRHADSRPETQGRPQPTEQSQAATSARSTPAPQPSAAGSPAVETPRSLGSPTQVSPAQPARPPVAASAAPVGVSAPLTTTAPGSSASTSPVGAASDAAARTRQPAAKPAAPAQPTPRNTEHFEKILRFVKLEVGKDHARTTIRLNPPELGAIRLKIEQQHHATRVTIEPQTALAHQMLRSDIESLRAGLEAAGVRLEQMELKSPSTTAQSFEPNQRDATFAQSESRRDSSSGHERSHAERGAAEPHTGATAADLSTPSLERGLAEAGLNVWA